MFMIIYDESNLSLIFPNIYQIFTKVATLPLLLLLLQKKFFGAGVAIRVSLTYLHHFLSRLFNESNLDRAPHRIDSPSIQPNF